MTATIPLPAPVRAKCEDMVKRSALAGCTTVTMGGALVTTVRPVCLLSLGEQILWRALDLIASGNVADLDIRGLRDAVDADSYDAVVAAGGVAA